MRAEKKVSIIVPAYNAERTLCECVDSLLAQTLKDIEIILVNDGSEDQTRDIINKYEKEYPGTIVGVHKTNGGVSSARNAGLSVAIGEFVGFVDSDDSVEPNMYEIMFAKAQETEADLVQCWHYDVCAGRKALKGPKTECTGTSIYERPQIVASQTPYVWDKIFKRSVIHKNHLQFEAFRYAEDCLFLFQFELYATGIEEVKEPLYLYKVRFEGSATASFGESLLDVPKALAKMNELAVNNGCFSTMERYLWRVDAHFYIRRINDFYNYRSSALQEELAKGFFDLFDTYFYNWKNTVRWVGATKKVEYYANAYRADWKKMMAFIRSPLLVKRARRKTVYLIVRLLKGKDCVLKGFVSILQKAKRMKKTISDRMPSIKYASYRKKPLRENVVLLTSYYGSSFSDSIYYMVKDLLQRDDLTIYVGSNNLHRDFCFTQFNGIKPKLVYTESDWYIELLATAKYVVCNSRFPSFFAKREGQVYLNTWHGTPLKTLGKSMKQGLKDIGNNQTQFMMCDYLLYPNEYTRERIMDSFFLEDLYTKKVLMCGYPRNSVFFSKDNGDIFRKRLGLEGKKLYMYMPTWRGETIGTAAVKKYKDEIIEILSRVDALLDDDVVMFVKLHQVVMRKIKLPAFKHIRTSHPYYENYQFLNMMDCLITDYSSVFFDFANARKEILLFTYDYEQYMEERGMYFNMDELPFSRVNTIEELALRMNSKEVFRPGEEHEQFLEKYCQFDSLHTNKNVNDVLLSGHADGRIRILDYAANAERVYKVYFMSNLSQKEQQIQFKELVRKADEDVVFVFAQWSFEKATNDLLAEHADDGITYVVTPGEMPATRKELLSLAIYRRIGLCRKTAKRLYSEELRRILPGIEISSISDYSNDPKFNDLCRAIGRIPN